MISHIQVLHQYQQYYYKIILYLVIVLQWQQKLRLLLDLYRMQQIDAGFHRNVNLELYLTEY